MREIKTTEDLATFCDEARAHPFVTIDTEFLRERTYYSQLCLIQMAYPGDGEGDAALIDALAPDLSLEPLYNLFRDTRVVKVFHAARQDLEIFVNKAGVLPDPLFDTQVAAMVCGYGEQVGYETLVRSVCKAQIDKSSRFTDWAQRPLSQKQKDYALADVTFLRDIYNKLAAELEKSGRASWVREELGVLTSTDTYIIKPEDAWKRLKTRTNSARFLGIARALAEWREREAQTRDIPRNRLMKDDALLELAANKPTTIEALGKSRLLLREARKGRTAEAIVAVVAEAMALPESALPKVPRQKNNAQVSPALMDLLRVLLKAKSEQAGVAQKLIATTAELEAWAQGAPEGAKLRNGWRAEIFGNDAAALRDGKLALTLGKSGVKAIDV
ncbi:ribonuclease D [Pontivivens insulae]|uniref:Ribonuclease D n=1 Tax=Pontivivens insulae TaxID=1639689 RepID=A0A2R8ABT0_9RHOB|nr:ribonuclease D [Pontivivens insulae]RED11292.1 ribonuclease D [Pontivivens insulae]SPF29535.1 Ribonuclease D [Pontivivens insulae]